ncbi:MULTISPECIES: DJ-1 family glyoxalase III [Gemella]|uniref:DJ-1 family glyoxalase III n=1 Tax=Gemella TaxID=1378 RepID=UPI00076834C0|nr:MULTISPECIES: DJ-1 family glyoxalase III [Gemella]AME10060.1 glutamine amidotransferase [Gemella sp. oral taxon 928]AXI26196.1 DJ-1 family protein [Gemella sp. ND 6198]
MTKKVALFVENGSEELEFIAPLDIMRRAGLNVDLISANNENYITGCHNVKVLVDKKLKEIENILDYDAIVIPGGLPGSTLLRDNRKIIEFYQTIYQKNKLVAAICAAPIVLSKAGILKDKEVTSYPGFKKEIECRLYNSAKAVVVDRNVITAQGPAVATLFGYEIVKYLLNERSSNDIASEMLMPILKNNL